MAKDTEIVQDTQGDNGSGTDAFVLEVERALKHFRDVDWLARYSPLAAPYFIGSFLKTDKDGDLPDRRAKALRTVIQDATKRIAPRLRQLLEIKYLDLRTRLDTDAVAAALHESRRTLFRLQTTAIAALATEINRSVVPPLRSELPVFRAMWGRKAVLTQALDELAKGQSVTLTGESGLGKTTLAGELIQRWAGGLSRVFWITLRPGLNDTFESVTFALAYFLRSHGAGNLWKQLATEMGKVVPKRVLGLLHEDFETLRRTVEDKGILVCVDEVDLLERGSDDHAQIIQLLDELKALSAVLVIGHRPLITTDIVIPLVAFDPDEVVGYLRGEGVPVESTIDVTQVIQHTRANPAMLRLLVAVYRLSKSLPEALSDFDAAASFRAYLVRLWRHLTLDQQKVLFHLAVFDTTIPKDAWARPDEMQAIEDLTRFGVVDTDARGGIWILGHVRQLIQDDLDAQTKRALHMRAAEVRETRGEYVQAMRHFVQADQADQAVRIWVAHSANEIARGNASIAFEILKAISPDDIEDPHYREAFRVCLGELQLRRGNLPGAEQSLSFKPTTITGTSQAYRSELLADVLERQGRVEQALEHYRQALDQLGDDPRLREIWTLTKIVFVEEARLGMVDQARMTALRARIKAEQVHGNVEARAGNFTEAKSCYQAALHLLERLGNKDLDLECRLSLATANLEWQMNDWDTAITRVHEVKAKIDLLADIEMQIFAQNILGAAHILAGRYEDSAREASVGLEMAQRLGDGYNVARMAATAAEASCYLDDLQRAEHLCYQTLNTEEGYWRTYALLVLGRVRDKQGKVEEAKKAFKEGIVSAKEAADAYGEAQILESLGDLYHHAHALEQAKHTFAEAIAVYNSLALSKNAEAIQARVASLEV